MSMPRASPIMVVREEIPAHQQFPEVYGLTQSPMLSKTSSARALLTPGQVLPMSANKNNNMNKNKLNNSVNKAGADDDDEPDFSASSQMAANVGKANRVQSSVDEMINSLAELYQTNSYWKNKYLQDRKQHFSQFMAPFQILRSQVFSEWKDFTFEHASDLKIKSMEEDIAKLHSDGEALLNEREGDFRRKLEQMERRHQDSLQEISSILDYLNTILIPSSLQEISSILDRQNTVISRLNAHKLDVKKRFETTRSLLRKASATLHSKKETDLAVHPDIQPLRPYSENFEYSRQILHDILSDVDPKYVPPVGSLCVGPPPAPVGFPGKR